MSLDTDLIEFLNDRRRFLLSREPNRPDDRRYNKYSQGQVAAKIGVSIYAIKSWEYGVCVPSRLDTWVQWCDALGVDFASAVRSMENRAPSTVMVYA